MLTPNYDDDDSGYETDATILDEDYDSETERAFNAKNRKRKISTPSTPEPMTQGPEPSTEILKKTGSPIYTRFEGMHVPYTRNSSNNGEMPLDINGEPIDLEELPPIIKRKLFKGGLAKSRRRRRAKKSSRKRHSRHTRKTTHKHRARSTRSKH
jgi:topoisomerase IA-like protein